MNALRPSIGLCSVCVVLAWCAEAAAQPAGKLQSPAGSLLVKGSKGFTIAKGDVATGEPLLALPGERAEVLSKSGGVQLTLWGNLTELYDYPILESAVVLNPDPARDFDITLERGRVLLTQQRAKRTAEVRVTFQKNAFTILLSEPGTQVALEAFGRWHAGAPVIKAPRPDRSDEVPTQLLYAYTVKGTASIKIGGEQYLMPAPASFKWDNVVGRDALPKRNAKLPAWTDDSTTKPEAKSFQSAVDKLRGLIVKNGPDKGVREALNATEPELRRVAVYSLGALDDLPGLVDALSNPRQPDVRSAAVLALQNWSGRAPGQDAQLYNFLTQQRMFTPGQGEIVLHLLHGYGEADRNRPETLDNLTEYLRHPKVAIRELAVHHLNRLLPEGRKILYDAGGSPAQVEQGYTEWRKLLPSRPLRRKS